MADQSPSQPYILALKPTARRVDRLTIHVGPHARDQQGPGQTQGKAKVVATLSRKRIDELGLAPGQRWDEPLAAKVQRAGAFDQAMDASTKRLNRRAMSRQMLEGKLRELDHDQATCRAVLDRLTEIGLIDDEAFGQALIRDTQAARPAGPHLLRKKLLDKGLDPRLTDRLIQENTPEASDQYEAGLTLARKRLATMGGLDKRTKLRRLQGLLARRGFETQVCRDVLESLSNEMDEEGE